MPAIQLVIFDCDGVLMDSEIVAARAELDIYKQHGVEMTPEEFAERYAGKDSMLIKIDMEELLGFALPDDVLSDAKSSVDERCGAEAAMITDADTVLDLFDQARCICSNSPPNRLQSMLGRVGLYDRFRPYVFSAQDQDPPVFKPKPDIILRALDEFDVTPGEALVVEDSVHGVEAALNAGARVIGFTGATHTFAGHADMLTEAGAETVIDRLIDLPPVIDAFASWSGIDS